MKGFILFDRDFDSSYVTNDPEIVFKADLGKMQVDFSSTSLLERAISLCLRDDLTFHILVTRWFAGEEAFEIAKHDIYSGFWWYEKLSESGVKCFLHLSKKNYREKELFLHTTARDSLGIRFPTREYLGRDAPIPLQDMGTLLFREGWLTAYQSNLWEFLLEEDTEDDPTEV